MPPRMDRMRQRKKPLRPKAAFSDFVRVHRGELFPRNALRQPNAHGLLQRFSVRHGDALGRAVAEVIALFEHLLMFAFDSGLGCHIQGHRGRERLVDGVWLAAGQSARALSEAFASYQGSEHPGGEKTGLPKYWVSRCLAETKTTLF
jgi:hypothetical protein